jgi:hypothetical protein
MGFFSIQPDADGVLRRAPAMLPAATISRLALPGALALGNPGPVDWDFGVRR